jgi:dehydrogenase/reductase SDR family member 12
MVLISLLDGLLELSVVGSFSRTGFLARRRLFGWTDLPAGSMRDRTVLITGPTSGLGRAMARRLAALGARIVLVGRDLGRLETVRHELTAAHGADRAVAVAADMSSLASVRAAVDQIAASEPRLDIVIDNAGAIFGERTTTPDGLEATFATMVAGPFALIAGLLPVLRRTGHARVIAVSSGGMYAQRLDLGDLAWERRPWNGTRAYAAAKRAQVALVREWARRVPPTEVTFSAMHPGWAATPGLAASLPAFAELMGPLLRTADEGADTAVWLADEDSTDHTGRLFLDRRSRPFDRAPQTRLSAADRRRLWDLVVGLADVADPAPDPRTGLPGTHPTSPTNGAT